MATFKNVSHPSFDLSGAHVRAQGLFFTLDDVVLPHGKVCGTGVVAVVLALLFVFTLSRGPGNYLSIHD